VGAIVKFRIFELLLAEGAKEGAAVALTLAMATEGATEGFSVVTLTGAMEGEAVVAMEGAVVIFPSANEAGKMQRSRRITTVIE